MDTILNTFLLFYIFCFAGWIWETSFISLKHKKFVNRGFLNGPYIPIYGFGGILVYLVLQRYSTTLVDINSIHIYVYGCIFATIVEYITSFLLEKIFKARWWDYSCDFLNLNGRICLAASLFWGFLSVIFVQVINPFLLTKVNILSHDLKLIIVTSMSTTMSIDLAITINAIINLEQKLTSIVKFEGQKLSNIKDKLSELTELQSEYKQMIIDYKYKLYNIDNPFSKRIINAFPKLKFTSDEKQNVFLKLKNIKKNITNKK